MAHISWIPKLTHNEAFRQKSLLLIRDELQKRVSNPKTWKISHVFPDPAFLWHIPVLKEASSQGWKLIAVNLPHFGGILSFFNQPGGCFADEISDRLKVIACLEKPNMFHSEDFAYPASEPLKQTAATLAGQGLDNEVWQKIREELMAGPEDAQILFWAPEEDIKTALETIEERCQMAFEGVPNETRKSLPGGITLFERVLPGADRMYPDTDSAPISIDDTMIEAARESLPTDLGTRLKQLADWQIPADAYTYLLRNNLMPVLEELSAKHGIEPKRLGLLYAHLLKGLQGRDPLPFDQQRVEDVLIFVNQRGLSPDILPAMLKVLFEQPNMQFSSVLAVMGYKEIPANDILEQIPLLKALWPRAKTRGLKRPDAIQIWMMGRLRQMALGNVPLAELRLDIQKELSTNCTD